MFHACLVSTLLCFVYTLRYFYTFSGTNLLTRFYSASCLFSAVFGFRKASKEIFSELDGAKPKSIFHRGEHRVQRRDGGVPQGRVWAPWLPSCLSSLPIKSPDAQNPKNPIKCPQNSL